MELEPRMMSRKLSMRMVFLRLVSLNIESIKIQRVTNLLHFYSNIFVFILFVAQIYILDYNNCNLWSRK